MTEEEAIEIARELRDIATEVECVRSLRDGPDPEGDRLYIEVGERFNEFLDALGV